MNELTNEILNKIIEKVEIDMPDASYLVKEAYIKSLEQAFINGLIDENLELV